MKIEFTANETETKRCCLALYSQQLHLYSFGLSNSNVIWIVENKNYFITQLVIIILLLIM